jgi:3-oxo-5-alpha-steroid 4-dehydrogenase 1
VYHDEILNDLRRPPQQRLFKAADLAEDEDKRAIKGHYAIPHGGLFRYVSFPNYFCEWYVLSPQTPRIPVPHISPSYRIEDEVR